MENNNNLTILVQRLLDSNTIGELSKDLNVAVGTIKRWIDNDNTPESYRFELMNLLGIKINYSEYNFKSKDQFFTPIDTAISCINKFKSTLIGYGENPDAFTYIEPSAGAGNFLINLPIGRRIGMDIEPRHDEIIKCNFFDWIPPSDDKYIVIGNPPFGLRGQLALKFINRASTFADYVAFILPQLFASDGKGVPRKRVTDLNLVCSEAIPCNFTDPSGNITKVQCIFQIWSKYHSNSEYDLTPIDTSLLNVYSLSDGGTSSTTRNKKMFGKCDVYIPSTCYGKHNMRSYDNFEELPGRKGYGIVFNKNKDANISKFKNIDWSLVAFLSTNSAYNIRTTQIMGQFST